MPPFQWTLHQNRPVIEVVLPSFNDQLRCLIADTGAGSAISVFQLILADQDCVNAGGPLMGKVQLGGAYSGWFPIYLLQVRLPQLNFDEPVPCVGVPQIPQGFDGIACFRFLNRFHYGNFGNPGNFGLG